MKNYAAFYEKHTGFLKKLKNPEKGLTLLNKVLTCAVALLYFVGAGMSAFSLFGAPLATLFALGVPLASTLVCITILRFLFPRKRPYDQEGAGITPICKKEKSSPSFPSRHTACAFAIATALLRLSPFLAIPTYLLGAILACVRFLSGFHYPSDLLGGAALGTSLGLLAFLF